MASSRKTAQNYVKRSKPAIVEDAHEVADRYLDLDVTDPSVQRLLRVLAKCQRFINSQRAGSLPDLAPTPSRYFWRAEMCTCRVVRIVRLEA